MGGRAVRGSGATLTDFQHPELIEAEGPTGQTSRLLQFQNIADDPNHSSTSRTEFHLLFPPNDYQDGHVRYWMKLADDLDQSSPSTTTPAGT